MAQVLRRNWFVFVASLTLAVVSMTLFSQALGLKGVAYADPQGIKYTGAGACSAVACHGAAAPKEGGMATRHNENSTWNKDDHHSKSFSGKKGLVSKESAEIAKKMGIADATKEGRCLNCHAVSELKFKEGATTRVPLTKEQMGAKFAIEDGVSCDACHGPASKYLDPHTAAGWTQKQRANGAQKVYDEWGLLDTKDLKFRANICISCHLKIDADMVAAGHPELPFELSFYSAASTEDAFSGAYAGIHWRDKQPFYAAKAWAMGQVVSLRESAAQLAERTAAKADAKILEASQNKVLAHAVLSRQVAKIVDPASQEAIDKALKDPKALVAAAEALADKVNKINVDQAMTEKFIQAVAAEGEQAGNIGYAGGEQVTWSLKSLAIVLGKDGKKDVAKQMEKIDALYEPMGDSATYDKAKYVEAVKGVAGDWAGGASIPLPK